MVAGDVSNVLSVVTPAVQPILSFAMSSAGALTAGAPEVQSLANEVISSVNSLLAPLGGLLESLGLGL
jgi:hypothetical protein